MNFSVLFYEFYDILFLIFYVVLQLRIIKLKSCVIILFLLFKRTFIDNILEVNRLKQVKNEFSGYFFL